jgi:hypothetical protein
MLSISKVLVYVNNAWNFNTLGSGRLPDGKNKKKPRDIKVDLKKMKKQMDTSVDRHLITRDCIL